MKIHTLGHRILHLNTACLNWGWVKMNYTKLVLVVNNNPRQEYKTVYQSDFKTKIPLLLRIPKLCYVTFFCHHCVPLSLGPLCTDFLHRCIWRYSICCQIYIIHYNMWSWYSSLEMYFLESHLDSHRHRSTPLSWCLCICPPGYCLYANLHSFLVFSEISFYHPFLIITFSQPSSSLTLQPLRLI